MERMMEQLALPFKDPDKTLAIQLIREHWRVVKIKRLDPWWNLDNLDWLVKNIKRFSKAKWFIRDDGCITNDEGWL